MTRPTTTSMMIAAQWLSHVTSYSAWDDMEEVLRSEPERAWRLILALVGSAPDSGVMSAVAAGLWRIWFPTTASGSCPSLPRKLPATLASASA